MNCPVGVTGGAQGTEAAAVAGDRLWEHVLDDRQQAPPQRVVDLIAIKRAGHVLPVMRKVLSVRHGL